MESLTTKRAAIYARFSTDLQNENSIEDQIALCRQYAAKEDIEVVSVYEDRARSGGSMLGRDGLARLVDDARYKKFNVLIIEAFDRLSRNMGDLSWLHERFNFLGIEIRAVHDGVANTITIGLRGLQGQMFREDNAHKVRRGLAGKIRSGQSAGGRSYGYAGIPGDPGKRIINEEEAAIVRRIYKAFLAGRTPRDIAHALNLESVKPPRGKSWNASTINGNMARGNGILQNELYAGRLVWNKVRMVKDPDTGKRVSRVNPSDQWQTVDVPDLAIISKEDFAEVQSRKKRYKGTHPQKLSKPKHILSGLLKCGACGSGMSVFGADKSGFKRIRCTRANESNTCPDPHTYYLHKIESRVLKGLRDELKNPLVITEYVKTYHNERKRLASRNGQLRDRAESKVAEIEREIVRLVDAIAKGVGDVDILGARMKEQVAHKKAIQDELAKIPEKENIIALHPAIMRRYTVQLEQLRVALAAGVREGCTEAAGSLRDLVEAIRVHHTPEGGEIEIIGRMAVLLGQEAFPNGMRLMLGGRSVGGERVAGERFDLSAQDDVCGKVVAREGFEPPTQGL